MSTVNGEVVLAAIDDMLEPMTTHRGTHLSIMRKRLERLREQVVQQIDPMLRMNWGADEESRSRPAGQNHHTGSAYRRGFVEGVEWQLHHPVTDAAIDAILEHRWHMTTGYCACDLHFIDERDFVRHALEMARESEARA